MKKLNTILMTIMACLFITSCHSEKMDNESVFTGELMLASLNASLDVKVDTVNLSRSTVDMSSYIVRIINDKQVETNKWTYSEMPEVVTLPVGAYSIEVSPSDAPEAGFDKPFYLGTQSFEIKKNEVTEIQLVVCKLANIRLSVVFDDKFRGLSSDDLNIKFSIGENSVDLGKADENKLAYLPALAEENMLSVDISGTVDGEMINESAKVDNVKKGYHHTVNIGFKGVSDGENKPSGGLNVSVEVDGSLDAEDENVSVHPGDEPGIGDFPSDGGDPGEGGDGELSIIGTSFKGSPFDIDGAPLEISINEAEAIELIVTLGAEKGMAHVHVTIDSETLTPEILTGVGLSDKFDLAEPGALEEGLKGLGFPVKDKVIGQTSIEFNITNFTQLMGIYGAASHNFIIRIIDQEGAELTKTLKIKSVE